jgi:protein NrfD
VILFLFLSHLGVGIAFTLAFVARSAGVKFFRFNAGLAAILLAIALALRHDGAQGIALGISGVAVIVYWATVGRALARIRPAIVGVGVAGGLIALILQAMAMTAGRPALVQALAAVSFLSSAALLGGACTAMILGHWYLVIPSLEVRHLQSIVKWHIASLALRVAVVAAVAYAAVALWPAAAEGTPGFRHYITSIDGIFFWQRVLFGLAAPSLLSYLTWETAKIRSTQSATGILYVDFFTVVVGEVLAGYLLLATGVPL